MIVKQVEGHKKLTSMVGNSARLRKHRFSFSVVLKALHCIPDDQEVGGDVQPSTCRLEAVYGHSLIINPYPRDISGNTSLQGR